MLAVVQIGGHQYLVKKGDVLQVEKVKKAQKGADFDIESVLLTAEGDSVSVGKPSVKSAVVKAQILDEIRDRKKIVFRYRLKKRERKFKGHRQTYSKIKILDIKTS